MSTEANERRVYVATETYAAVVDGAPVVVHKGVTRVREGHKLILQNPQYFELAGDRVHFEVEQATAEPGEKRAAPAHREAAHPHREVAKKG